MNYSATECQAQCNATLKNYTALLTGMYSSSAYVKADSCLSKPSGFSLTYLFYLGPIGSSGLSDQTAGILICVGVLLGLVLLCSLTYYFTCHRNRGEWPEEEPLRPRHRRRMPRRNADELEGGDDYDER